jgi:signal transduction histidine kinase
LSKNIDPTADIEAIAEIEAVPTILEVVCRTTGMRFAAVARVTEDRWIACSVRDEIQFGLEPGSELQIETTICNEIRGSGTFVAIDHVAEDENFCRHPTPEMYGFQSYISMPIVLPDGGFFGTLCAIDPRPARVNTPATIGMFKLFADLIAFHMDAQRRIAASEASLFDERRTAELREQFIAVLGHDLRNPLASVDAGVQMLTRMPLTPKAESVLRLMRGSVTRMAGLIENMLDFARGRLGGGLPVDLSKAGPLTPVLEQVIAELRAASPHRRIEARLAIDEPIRCDQARIGQLCSNLLANALAHGAADAPVHVEAATTERTFTLSVANRGNPIPPHMLDSLFEPFFRASARPGQQGLGLGLYIASEIARAHGGALTAISTPAETRFTFRMKLR